MREELARDNSRERIKATVRSLPFKDLPGQSSLFKAYLSDPLSLREFYPNVEEFPIDVEKYIPTVLNRYDTDRQALCDSLATLNSELGAGPKTIENINALREPRTVAVVSGQQTGLFGGPLYTVYKALSAIRLASELNSRGHRAVPVFWMATEDHDFEEVSTTYFFSGQSKLYRSVYCQNVDGEGTPVGNIVVDKSISTDIECLAAALSPSSSRDAIKEELSRSWGASHTFGRAFGQTIADLTSKYGLILFDPQQSGLKHLSARTYGRAVECADDIVEAIVNRDIQLEEHGFHSQVMVDKDYFPLFWIDDSGARRALRRLSAGVYGVKGQKVQFTRDELHQIAEHQPDRLSPGVMLRPVVQDDLLPTAAYFGGGAEISYFAQNSVVYEILDRPVTPIFHRQSFTILQPRDAKSIRKLGLEYLDLFMDSQSVAIKWAEGNIPPAMANIFTNATKLVNNELDKIKHVIESVDGTLIDHVEKRRRKMLHHISALRTKTLRAISRKNGDAQRRISELHSVVMPNGHLQERSINVYSFVNTFGRGFIDLIYESVDLSDKGHRIIEISNE